LVRVGGLVTELLRDGFRLDDGTTVGRVVLADGAIDSLPLIEPGDAINVIGRVQTVDGSLAVVVADPTSIVLGSDPTALLVAGSAPPTPSIPAVVGSPGLPRSVDARAAGFGDDLSVLPGAGAGLATLIGISLASVVMTVLRRRHARRLMMSRVAVRLAALVGPESSGSARTHERGPRTD
jgi:hypothetical protein